jgi:hypothetical protein
MDPVINVNLHPEVCVSLAEVLCCHGFASVWADGVAGAACTQGKYAFIEFRTPDMATAALALNGQVQLLGCNLSVARPSG